VSSGSRAAKTRHAFCSALSSAIGEPLAATASRIDHWVLLEYGGAWARDSLGASLLSPDLKEHLRTQLAAVPRARLLFVKKPARGPRIATRVFFGTSRPGTESLFELKVERADELLGVELAAALARTDPGAISGAEAVEGPLFLVCTHGKRDRCCALHGRPLYDALRHEAGAERIWQSTHVGGDRFAGNVVVLPYGLYYGRVGPDDAAALLAATGSGQIDVDRYRGRSAYSFPVQAAERAVRVSERLFGIDDLTLLAAARSPEGRWQVRFRTPDNVVHELQVDESVAEEPTNLTCDSTEPRRARRWVVSAHEVLTP
jgi:hypothetical protein